MNRRTFLRRTAAGAVGVSATAGTAAATGTATSNATAGGSAGNASANDTAGGAGGSAGSKTHTIEMWTKGGDYYFDPVGLYVDPGDTVRWVVKSDAHSATTYSPGNPSDGGARRIPKKADGFNSGVLKHEGATFEHTFTVTGTYDLYCIPHKSLGMVARIVCGKPGGPAEESPIPNDPSSGLMPPSKTIVDQGSVSFPYVPHSGHRGALPWQFWVGSASLGAAFVYLAAEYDGESDRYGPQNLPDGPDDGE